MNPDRIQRDLDPSVSSEIRIRILPVFLLNNF
jgi:hypothetical protein